jgi:hypothetical protein
MGRDWTSKRTQTVGYSYSLTSARVCLGIVTYQHMPVRMVLKFMKLYLQYTRVENRVCSILVKVLSV